MKIKFSIFSVLLAGLLLTILPNCKKEADTTPPPPPVTIAVLTTNALSAITSTTATSGGNISSDGGAAVTARGVCWSTSQNPTIADSKTSDGTGTGSFTSSVTGLTPGATYYFRAYATNSVGTAYGSQITTTISTNLPVLTTIAVSAITSATATSGGNITSDGGAAVTARGVCWSMSQNPTIADSKTSDGTGSGSFTGSITGLTPVTTYYFRAYATNSIGTAYGAQVSATTAANLPTLTTTAVSAITYMSATSGGNITSNGGATITARGVCWSTSQNPTTANSKTTDGTGNGSFTSSLTQLTDTKLYYLRSYATNSAGTAYGSEISFTTLQITDIDGNVYHSVTIGTQVWLVENLKTTKYRNGNSIPNVTDATAWASLNTGAYCDYNNDANIATTYGRLYNGYAVIDSRNIAPTGWHVATNAEWAALATFLGGLNNAGGKLKEVGTTHWKSPNTGATNESGFTALPGGSRSQSSFVTIPVGNTGIWWSSSAIIPYSLDYNNSTLSDFNFNDKQDGRSVRCVRDF